MDTLNTELIMLWTCLINTVMEMLHVLTTLQVSLVHGAVSGKVPCMLDYGVYHESVKGGVYKFLELHHFVSTLFGVSRQS